MDELALTNVSSEIREDGDSFRPLAVFAVVLAGICAFLDLYPTQPLLPLFVKIFHASKAAVGLTISASTLGIAVAAPIVGTYSEQFRRKRVIVASIFALAIPTLLAACVQTLPELIVCRLLQGALLPGIFATAIAYITEEWSAATVAIVMALYVSGNVLGGFLGRLIAGLIAEAHSWQLSFIVLAALTAVGGVLVALWLPPQTHRAEAVSVQVDSHIRRMFHQLGDRDLLITFIVGFNILFALVSIFTYVTFHLAASPYRFSTADLSLVFTVYLVGLIATPAGGVLLTHMNLHTGVLLSILLSLAGVLLTLAPPLWCIVLGLVLCSSGVFISQTAAMSYLREAAPAGARVAAAGMYLCFYYVGGTAAGIVPDYVWRIGGWPACVALTGSIQCITIMLVLFGWRRRSDARPVEDTVRAHSLT